MIVLLLQAVDVCAQADGEDRGWALEIGPAAEWPLYGERPNYGGSIAAEKEVIENSLELELGFAALGVSGRRELSGDLLFKKPFHLSPTIEIEVGAGPSVARTLTGPDRRTVASMEFVLDFFFWPLGDVGWFVEPAWAITPATGQKSLGVTGGLVVVFP